MGLCNSSQHQLTSDCYGYFNYKIFFSYSFFFLELLTLCSLTYLNVQWCASKDWSPKCAFNQMKKGHTSLSITCLNKAPSQQGQEKWNFYWGKLEKGSQSELQQLMIAFWKWSKKKIKSILRKKVLHFYIEIKLKPFFSVNCQVLPQPFLISKVCLFSTLHHPPICLQSGAA